jgi:hypothetical protein
MTLLDAAQANLAAALATQAAAQTALSDLLTAPVDAESPDLVRVNGQLDILKETVRLVIDAAPTLSDADFRGFTLNVLGPQ